jgi:hypothetical protein
MAKAKISRKAAKTQTGPRMDPQMDANGTANGHEWTRKDPRRGVAFRVLARTGVDARETWQVWRFDRRDALGL